MKCSFKHGSALSLWGLIDKRVYFKNLQSAVVYSLERGELNLSVAEAFLQLQHADPTPAVLFSGSFQYEIGGELEGEKLQRLYQLLQNWHPDLEAYREIVNERFLGKESEQLLPLA